MRRPQIDIFRHDNKRETVMLAGIVRLRWNVGDDIGYYERHKRVFIHEHTPCMINEWYYVDRELRDHKSYLVDW